MSRSRTEFFRWPGWKNLAYGYGLLGLPLLLWFLLIYGGADHVTGLHSFRVRLHFTFERSIPFVPAMVLFYNSFHAVYLATPFILRTRHEMSALVATWFLITLCGGIVFLLLPAENIFPTPTDAALGPWLGMFRLADRANLDYNMCPSLHVAWAVAGVDVFAGKTRWIGKVVLWSWAVCLTLSTLLVHQHYVADVVAGVVLAMCMTRLLYPRLRDGRLFQHPSPTEHAPGEIAPTPSVRK